MTWAMAFAVALTHAAREIRHTQHCHVAANAVWGKTGCFASNLGG